MVAPDGVVRIVYARTIASAMAMGKAGNFNVRSTTDMTSMAVFTEAARDCWINVVLDAHMLAIKIMNMDSAEMQMAPIGSICDIKTHAICIEALIGVCIDALARKRKSPPLNDAAAKKSSDNNFRSDL